MYIIYFRNNIKFEFYFFKKNKKLSRPISWVLLNTIINLVCLSPNTSSSLPKSSTSSTIAFLFGLAPSGVYLASNIAINCGELLPHHFTLTIKLRFIFCCTFRKFTLPRCYLALYSMEPRLSSLLLKIKRLHSRLNIIRY